MIRNVRNILKVNTRICKRFSTNSEHKTLLFSIKDDLHNIRDELFNIKRDLHNTKMIVEKEFVFILKGAMLISAVLGGTICGIIGINI